MKKGSIYTVVRKSTQRYLKESRGHLPQNLYEETLKQVECALLHSVLEYTEGNISQSAKILGMTRNTLRRKIVGCDNSPFGKAILAVMSAPDFDLDS